MDIEKQEKLNQVNEEPKVDAQEVDSEVDSQYDGGDIAKDGIKINEDPDKCCIVVPMSIGIPLIGIVTILLGLQALLNLLDVLKGGGIVYIIVNCAILAPLVLAAGIWVLFFIKKDTTRLPLAILCVIISQAASLVWLVITVLFYKATFSSLLSGLISAAISVFIMFYYLGVVNRFRGTSS